VGAKLFYEAAAGGVDIVKDDELLADAPFSHIEERTKEFMAAEKRAYQEKGERTLYAVNITDRVDKIKENAQKAISAGANCLMLNYLTVGIDALRMLAEEKSIQVPILAHLDFAGTMYESHNSGISSHLVLGKFPRLAGADMVVYPCPYAKFLFMREKHLRIALALKTQFYHLKPTFPMPSGGVYPGILPILMQDIGRDWIVGAGGAVHGHPMGATAGAKALRQAIDALMEKVPLEEAQKEHKELKAAIDAWGIYKLETKVTVGLHQLRYLVSNRS
jgi:2,3-diketo-5-methylthiopentyl-1-phosphate enolase